MYIKYENAKQFVSKVTDRHAQSSVQVAKTF